VSAHDANNLNQIQFFHRSFHDFNPGDMVEPRLGQNSKAVGQDGKYSFAGTTPGSVHSGLYGDKTYEVQPQGPLQADPSSVEAYRSRQPMRVVRQVPEGENDDKYYSDAYGEAEANHYDAARGRTI
jgi:hypothetical protein